MNLFTLSIPHHVDALPIFSTKAIASKIIVLKLSDETLISYTESMETNAVEIKNFHAHVYFDLADRDAAARVRQGLDEGFEVQLGRWHEVAIGPHPKSMYQVLFSPQQFGEVVPWLMLHREGLDILVHPTTGDDVADHTDHALWLGEKLALKIEVLRKTTTTQ